MKFLGINVSRLLHAFAITLSIVFVLLFSQLSRQFMVFQERSLVTQKPQYILPASIWKSSSLRGGACPVQIPPEVDHQFHSLWNDSSLSPPEPCKRPAVGASRIVRGRYLQPIPNRCRGRLVYQTATSINMSSNKPLVKEVDLQPNQETVFVKCVDKDGIVTRDWHVRVEAHPDVGQKTERPQHVVLILVDSVTREHALRTLPKSLSFMKQSSSHQMSDFTRFNAVGKGTKMNFTPVMFGMSSSKYSHANKTFVSIIDRYHQAGFATAFIEEGCVKNTGSMARIISRKVKADLTKDEVAAFMQTFAAIADHTLGNVMCMIMKHMNVHDFFSESTLKNICYAGQYMHRYLFSYLSQFISQYKAASKSTFSILKTNEAHERTYTRIGQVDRDLEMFLRSIDNDTTVIVMGDHGLGYGKLSETLTLTIEYNLPALFFFTPTHTGYHKRLQANSARLITGLDLHATLVDMLLHPSQNELATLSDGMSLLTPVPDRSCKDLAIPSVRCSCSVYTQEKSNTTLWRVVAERAVAIINNDTEAWRDKGCRRLNLSSIVGVRQIRGNSFGGDADAIARGEEHSVFQLTLDVNAGQSANGSPVDFERFMLEVQAKSSWWRPAGASQCVVLVQIEDIAAEVESTGSRPNILLGIPNDIYISIGWNETSCIGKSKQLRFEFISSSNRVVFSQITGVEKGWSSSRSTVTNVWTFLQPDEWNFVVTDVETEQVQAIAKVHVLDDSNRKRSRLARRTLFDDHFTLSTLTRISPYSPFHVCTPAGAPRDKCICDKAIDNKLA